MTKITEQASHLIVRFSYDHLIALENTGIKVVLGFDEQTLSMYDNGVKMIPVKRKVVRKIDDNQILLNGAFPFDLTGDEVVEVMVFI